MASLWLTDATRRLSSARTLAVMHTQSDGRGRLRWGVLATGRIARTLSRAIVASQSGRLCAIASRSQEGADALPREGLPADLRVLGSYEELIDDDAIDVVYVATPHSSHHRWTLAAIAAGKHVLCEKPLTVAAWQAEELVTAARQHRVFLMEAFMYRAHPQTWKLVELVCEGVIGEPRVVRAGFGMDIGDIQEGRLVRRDLAGGAILDLGCYPASLIRLIAGAAQGRAVEPETVTAVARINPRAGTDDWSAATMIFADGVVASIECAMRCRLERSLVVAGSEGMIRVENPWQLTSDDAITLLRPGHDPETIGVVAQAAQAVLEVDAVGEAIRDRRQEAWQMPWADSLGNMRTLDRWRAAVDLRYEADDHGPGLNGG